jgi:hypothetical protein
VRAQGQGGGVMPGQLSLFKGKQQRGVKAPPAAEFLVHCAIADTLNRWLMPGWVWFHPPNGGERPARIIDGRRVSVEGGRLKRMGARSGTSDFILCGPPNGRMHALELKRQGLTPTEDQTLFGKQVALAGGAWAWCDGYKPAIHILQVWGALPVNIKVT